ncbi:signal peptide protein [Streptomyces hygroscopicus]|nr:signal peptide protein [Streptomyces hygroscopicus]
MTRYADIPKPIRSGIVLVDPERGTPQRIIVLQFNPDTLERPLALQSAGGQADSGGGGSGGGVRNEALRLKGPAQETWKFTAEIDATDQFEVAAPDGIHPQLATLEMLVQPTTAKLRDAMRLSKKGTIEISPIEMPLTLLVEGFCRSRWKALCACRCRRGRSLLRCHGPARRRRAGTRKVASAAVCTRSGDGRDRDVVGDVPAVRGDEEVGGLHRPAVGGVVGALDQRRLGA